MAVLIATANGNFTAAATWKVVDATSFLDAQTAVFTIATSPSWSSGAGFTPGIITIDGIAVKIGVRLGTTGTVSVRLFNVTGGAAVAGTTVTVNMTDVSLTTGSAGNTHTGCSVGWMFFKFAAPVALAAATQYRVEAQTSTASMLQLFRDGTANNMARMLRTTTTAAPGAGDSMFILGEWTAAATKTNRTVTMDSTAATDYGSGSTTLASLGIANGGRMDYAAVAATNYVLRLSGLLQVWVGGVMNVGQVATPIPRDSTAVLEFDCATTGDFGAVIYGIFRCQGQSRTSGKNITYALLTADAAGGATSFSVDRDTGWLNGDDVVITATSRTRTDGEILTLNGAAGASSFSTTAGSANAHAGTSPVIGEVGLLSRNVQVRSTLSTAGAYIETAGETCNVDLDWTLFRYIYGTAANTKSGLIFKHNSGGTFSLDYCASRDAAATAYQVVVICTQTTISISNFVVYGAETSNNGMVLFSSTGSATTITLTDWVVVNDAASSTQGVVCAMTGSYTVTRFYGSGGACALTFSANTTAITGTLTLTDVSCHASGAAALGGLNITLVCNAITLTRVNCWRNNGLAGLSLLMANASGDIFIDDCKFFGNTTNNIAGSNNYLTIRMQDCILGGDTSFSTAYGINHTSGIGLELRAENCQFSVVTGIYVAHTTTDIGDSSVNAPLLRLIFVNTVLGAATEIQATLLSSAVGDSFVAYQRKDGTTNTHSRVYPQLGTIAYETTTFRTASPSEKLTPAVTSTGRKMRSSSKRIAVTSGLAITVSVYVQKSAGYTGSAPRLLLKANPALGIDSDTVLDTMAGGSGSWEELSGTSTPVAEEDGVLECYVDCDGSAGDVYVDDWSAVAA